MRTGLVKPNGYSATYLTNQLSPGVWDTCPGSDLNQLATGYFAYFHYENGFHPASLLFTDAGSTTTSGQAWDNSSTLTTNVGTTAVSSTAGIGHVITLTGGSTSTSALAGRVGIVTRPIGSITPGGLGYWFEACVTVTNSTTQGAFVGIATLPALSTGGSTGGGIISTVTATRSTNTLIGSTGAIGFWMHGASTLNFDAIYQNQTSGGSTNSGISTVLQGVLTSSTGAIVPVSIYTGAIGPVTPPGLLTSTQCVKLGLKYLPQGPGGPQMQWYVNGAQVAAVQVTTAGFDVANQYGAIVEFAGPSTGTASQMKVDFLAVAAQQTY